ncbi:hypothetical protein CB1_000533017 [Camelus ferus]|nr:hypothetical protein CB1_000533017 [Camelus ferus]
MQRNHEVPRCHQLPCGLAFCADLGMLGEDQHSFSRPRSSQSPLAAQGHRASWGGWTHSEDTVLLGQVNRLPFFTNHFFDTYLLISEDTPVVNGHVAALG